MLKACQPGPSSVPSQHRTDTLTAQNPKRAASEGGGAFGNLVKARLIRRFVDRHRRKEISWRCVFLRSFSHSPPHPPPPPPPPLTPPPPLLPSPPPSPPLPPSSPPLHTHSLPLSLFFFFSSLPLLFQPPRPPPPPLLGLRLFLRAWEAKHTSPLMPLTERVRYFTCLW